MRLKRPLALFAGAFVLAAPASGRTDVLGDIIGFPAKLIFGSTLDKAQGNIDAAVGKALDTADIKLRDHEGRISDLATALVDRTNNALDARITQATTGLSSIVTTDLKNTLDDAIGKVGGVGEELIDRLGDKATVLIKDVDDKLNADLTRVDTIVRTRSEDVNRMLEERVTQTNLAIEERIVQIDEVARGRLGDVNAIANQQRIALEAMLARIAVVIGGVAFLVFAMKALLARYNDLFAKGGVTERGARRTMFFARRLAPALVGPLLGAFVGIALLGALYRFLPSSATQAGDELVAQHRSALADSVRRIDPPRARFEASHLGYLDADNAAHYAGLAQKTALLRDVIFIPGLLATEASRETFRKRLREAELALGPRPDPDLLTLRAIDRWKSGNTRRAEHEAASLAARALRLAPRGFGLAPLARAYLETFLNQPFIVGDELEGRDAATLEELSDALSVAAPDPPDSPFANLTALAGLMRGLEAESTQAYVQMAQANARAVVASARGKADQAKGDLALRTAAAKTVVEKWMAFDQTLAASDRITGPVLLNVFGLNDALFTRALWFAKNPAATNKRGIALRQVEKPVDRLQLAPARVAWSRRYGELMSAPIRAVLEVEQASQFTAWERWAIEFEDALVALEEKKGAQPDDPAARWRVVVATSALGLYVKGPLHRVPLARELAGKLTEAPPSPLSVSVPPPKKGKALELPLGPPTITDAPKTLEGLLGTRGQRLI